MDVWLPLSFEKSFAEYFTGMRHEILASLLLVALIQPILGCAGSGGASSSRNSHSKTGDATVCILSKCEMVRSELDRAIAKSNVNVPEEQRSLAVRRAVRLEEMLKGVRVLWVDDHPENNDVERNMLGALGMIVDLAPTTELAMQRLKGIHYDLVVSDILRNGDEKAGLQLLAETRKLGLPPLVIFYAQAYDPGRGVPPYAFGMTNRPDELLNLILDVIERLRSELEHGCCNDNV